MQKLRLGTLASLENIVVNLQQDYSTETSDMQSRIEEQIRLNKDRMTRVEMEIVRILDELKRTT